MTGKPKDLSHFYSTLTASNSQLSLSKIPGLNTNSGCVINAYMIPNNPLQP